MKKNKKKNWTPRPGKPFEAMIKQLEKETVVLVNMDKFESFTKALKDNDIDYDLGDFYNVGETKNIIVVKK